MKSMKLVAPMIALACFACRGGGDDDDGNDGNNGDGTTTADDTIFDIQSEDMPAGQPVTVHDVVVVAVDGFGEDQGRLWVMEREGGPFSGVLVFGADPAGLAPGDLVDIEGGEKDEFALSDLDSSGRTVTEISAREGGSIAISKKGTTAVPEPEVLLPWELAADDAESEKWEGVLVTFENVRVNGSLQMVGTDASRQRMNVTGPYEVQSDLTALADIQSGDCYASITGVGDYFITYKLLPRSADDLSPGRDADCLAPESGDALCDDGLDNDRNGFADCEDFGCADAALACPISEATIAAIQSGDIPPDSPVSLRGVTVTGVSSDRRDLWVQDGQQAAANAGVYVFRGSGADLLPADVEVGSTLDIRAKVAEFPCVGDTCAETPLTELTEVDIDLASVAPGVEPIPLDGIELATLASDQDGEPYEGVLVTIENVAVVSPNDAFGLFVVGDGTTELVVDTDIFTYQATMDECLASITGIMHRDVFLGPLSIVPRSSDDVITGGTCD